MKKSNFEYLLTSDSFFHSPWSTYKALREEAPVYMCESWGQWILSKYSDVSFMLKNPQLFSSEGWEEKYLNQLPSNSRDKFPSIYRHYETKVVSNVDPPDHTRLRKLLNRSFTPRTIEALRPLVESIVSEMLEKEEIDIEFNFVSKIAYPLPATLIALLLGAPIEDRTLFEKWSSDIVAFVGSGTPQTHLAINEEKSLLEFRSYLEDLIKVRRLNPKDDLISSLISKSDDGDVLTKDELISTCITLLFAGHETTANLLSGSLFELLNHRSQVGMLIENPSLVQGAVEETLRFNSPVQRIRRVALENVEINGCVIPKGASVIGFLGSANRDDEVFQHPESFQIDRTENSHLAFGGGIHFCIGAALSRLEAPILINRIFSEYPNTDLAEKYVEKYRPNMTFRGLDSLDVVFRR